MASPKWENNQLEEISTKCLKEDSNFILILDSLDHQMTTILLNTKSKDRIVESYDRYNSYLLTVDKISKYSWIFPTVILTRQAISQTVWTQERQKDKM